MVLMQEYYENRIENYIEGYVEKQKIQGRVLSSREYFVYNLIIFIEMVKIIFFKLYFG